MHAELSALVGRIDECRDALSAARAGVLESLMDESSPTEPAQLRLAASVEAMRTAQRSVAIAYSLLLEAALAAGCSPESLDLSQGGQP